MNKNKRFTDDGFEAIEDQSFTDTLTKKTYYVDYFDEVVDLCNSLWEQTKRFEKHNKDLMEENEQLKSEIEKLSYANEDLLSEKRNWQRMSEEYCKLSEENEQLKSTINTLTHDNTKMKKVLNTTKKENEHIKQVIKEAYNNERTQLGQSVLKQLMEAIQ